MSYPRDLWPTLLITFGITLQSGASAAMAGVAQKPSTGQETWRQTILDITTGYPLSSLRPVSVDMRGSTTSL